MVDVLMPKTGVVRGYISNTSIGPLICLTFMTGFIHVINLHEI